MDLLKIDPNLLAVVLRKLEEGGRFFRSLAPVADEAGPVSEYPFGGEGVNEHAEGEGRFFRSKVPTAFDVDVIVYAGVGDTFCKKVVCLYEL